MASKQVDQKCSELRLEKTSINYEQWRRQRTLEEALPITLFNSQEKTTSTLNGDFLCGQRLIEILLRMQRLKQDRHELINLCKQSYESDHNELQKLVEYETSYESHTPVWWYTRESCLFKLLNKALRVQDVDMLFSFRSFIQDVYQQLQQLHQNERSTISTFRFQLMKKDEIRTISRNQNQFLSINSFLSTSVDEDYPRFLLASVLSNLSNPQDDLEPVLLKIVIDPTGLTTRPYADITRESFFPNEREILFSIGCIFQVIQSRKYDNYWAIDIRLCEDNENQLKEAYDYMQKTTERQTTIESLAKLLRETGKYNQAKKYYQKFLDQSDPESKEAGYSYQGLGLIADNLGDYDQAIFYFEKHLQLHQSRENNQFEIANAMQNIAISCDAKGDHKRALECYQHALEIKKTLFGEDHTHIADLYYNIGITYGVQGNENKALEYYQKALAIYEKQLPADHLDIANVISNIGSSFQQKGDFDAALQSYEKALAIKLKTIPETHEYVGREYNQIGHLHLLKENYVLALEFLLKAKAVFEHQALLPTHADVVDNEAFIQRVKCNLH
ncbi:unnamed protein product [Rotaria socialis]|uniref:Uncharacterized protein n=1 Tax=Rotaria socialis TaxID=392032 RepID=A0A821Q6I3_9BILA|nr:unnamed protein product [Rotaria socialis]CAF4818924.1 unnamed protein product [Rotaria socialis]